MFDESGRCRKTSGVLLHACGDWEGPVPRLPTRPALALLGALALLCLAACTPTARPATVARTHHASHRTALTRPGPLEGAGDAPFPPLPPTTLCDLLFG